MTAPSTSHLSRLCLAALLAVALPALPGAAAQPGAAADPLAAACARGVLVVGVPFLADAPLAGAKVRTPERLDGVAAERLARQLGLPLQLRRLAAGDAAAQLASGAVDLVLADRRDGAPLAAQAPGMAVVGTGYATAPKAVIRGDTALRRWQDVAGRSVCMADAAQGAQALAQRHGATVRTYRAPSDALVAVREGACDLALIDDAVWAPLMKFPEWKKFSATLAPQGPRAELVWLAAARRRGLAGRADAGLAPRGRLDGHDGQMGARRGLRRVPGPGSARLPRLGVKIQ
ncbi:substrate-binding protein [Bordetella pertussis]|uniref:Bacterial extracellular solute-binding proteins, family 3 n=2 Tax=Bordetella pertussis TaxID=520 RepID=A0A381A539_BORPT|nr:ABC transporter, substrate-binding protein, family 3 [Bordetella pertussis CHLA-11]ETG98824.1 ABC transporter, substrate-binding protein, family 3 [Bordetella pertussis 2250905]ETH05634.1 ABC transporter, substrate-binding protein, family 3 [Bordetella pertussis 2356847]ETH06850.1 ABC transporter, substrate-binding protein, family 3 [Bordetella pertussis 2371640]ETH19820.1 ABC transporter, substrate-binding protein, family 3 [Bordetella pertussis CHLA-13]ETH23138.1 ABC transporter, substrat